MKRSNKKLLTLMLAGALCAATIGGVAGLTPAKADETTTAEKATISSLFSKENSATLTGNKDEMTKLNFTNKDGDAIILNRDLALKWYNEAGEKTYMSLTFAFEDLTKFEEASIVINTDPAVAVDEGIAINTIKFKKDGDVVKAAVFTGDDDSSATYTAVTLEAGNKIAVQLAESTNDFAFAVKANGTPVGEMTNVGANYAAKGDSLTFKAKANGTETATILLHDINGQSFAIVENGKIEDTAKPVLVLNEELKGLLLGTQFDITYKAIDVLKSTVTVEDKFYQYNPADTKIEEHDIGSKHFFMDTAYYVNEDDEVSATAQDGYKKTSVYAKEGKEYVSIVYELSDGTFTSGKSTAGIYQLAWYTDADFVAEKTLTVKDSESEETTPITKKYIILNRNDVGPKYAKEYETKEDWEKDQLVIDYQDLLDNAAKKLYAGTGETLNLPALDKLIVDENNDYKTLKFTVSYKTPLSSTPSTSSTSNKLASALSIPTTSEGLYEFKIFAVDAIGNSMKYELDGKLVDVTANNVWDIEGIPTFTFTAANKGLGIPTTEDDSTSDLLDKKNLNESYSMSSIKVRGATSQGSSYVLYKVDDSLWKGNDALDQFTKIKYNYSTEELNLNKKVQEILATNDYAGKTVEEVDYQEVYLKAYAQLLAGLLNKEVAEVEASFTLINEYDSRLEADEGDNVYSWSATSKRFTCAEEGLFLIMADHWDTDLISDRVAAYQLIEVRNDATDEIAGVSNWWKNNWVSIMLFSIAGALGIAILVLLFVKPSDETLADVDKKAEKVVRTSNRKNK